jgi:hypothetical protein
MAKINYSVSVIIPQNPAVGFPLLRLTVFANFVGTAQARVYLDGSGAPAFTNMSTDGDGNKFLNNLNLPAGLYRIDYNDTNGIKYLGKYRIYATTDDSCFPEVIGSLNFLVSVTDTKVQFGGSAVPGREISIDGGATYKPVIAESPTFGTTQWTNIELNDLDLIPVIPDVIIRRVSNSCVDTMAEEINTLEEITLDELIVNYSKTNCTAAGADDGAITLFPSGGSGNREYVWSDGPTTQNRANLEPGFYTVTITDLETLEEVILENIQITEPMVVSPNEGTLLEVPLLNTLRFVVNPVTPDGSSVYQQPDNMLFKDQVYPGFAKSNYAQKICKSDVPVIQFNSDFEAHTVQLHNACNDEVVKTFTSVLKEQNIGVTEDHAIRIENHTTPGQSRVYFQVGALPIPLSVGDVFEIVNNVDGFNGSYSIVSIINDTLLGTQYLVITKNYGIAAPTSNATGRFLSNSADFNVYESVLTLLDVANGDYYVKIRAFSISGGVVVFSAFTEPIKLAVEHPFTNLIDYRNIDNSFDITWTTGYAGFVRVESLIGHKRVPGGDRSIARNSSFDLIKTSARKTRGMIFETFMLPPWLHEKLSVIFDLDEWSINKVKYQSSEGYEDPNYIYKFLLANSSITIEQQQWFKAYNSHDIGTVDDGGFLITESGFLKR